MKKTQLIGILNCTPDSFFDGGLYLDKEAAIDRGLQLFEEGADIVDIGGESTRPFSKEKVSAEEEMRRIIPVIEGIRKQTDSPLSIDTFKPIVAQAALDAGVNMLNDITGFTNPLMREIAANREVPIIVMHMKGSPYSNPSPHYPTGVVSEICSFFQQQTTQLLSDGVKRSQIILDPGIGGGSFGKSPQQCIQILKHIKTFQALGYPLLIALSRKSFMQKILDKDASEVLSTTLALNTMSAQMGAAYIRVHDVAEHRDIISLLEYMETIA